MRLAGALLWGALAWADPVCADTYAMEGRSMAGELTPDDVDCLERLVETGNAKASRMLVVHRVQQGDMPEVRAHEERFGPDPRLHYKLALVFVRRTEPESLALAVLHGWECMSELRPEERQLLAMWLAGGAERHTPSLASRSALELARHLAPELDLGPALAVPLASPPTFCIQEPCARDW